MDFRYTVSPIYVHKQIRSGGASGVKEDVGDLSVTSDNVESVAVIINRLLNANLGTNVQMAGVVLSLYETLTGQLVQTMWLDSFKDRYSIAHIRTRIYQASLRAESEWV